MTDRSISSVLRERASLQPNDTAFTFVDYDQDWDGVPTTLTWAQLYRRTLNLAAELQRLGSPGDRAVILAPQSLEYIVAFLASLEAGIVAVPLSVPMVGVHDERVSAVLRDASPSIILTTSSVAETVTPYAQAEGEQPAPSIVEVDSLDLDARGSRPRRVTRPEVAYLQYTSGSTRTPAGVMVTNRNLSANFEQIMAGLFPDYTKVPPPDTVVSWLPFYHDMGLMLGMCSGILGGWPTVLMSPIAFLQRPARWVHLMASYPRTFSAAPNFAFELAAARTSDEDMAGYDLGNVLYILSGAERVNPTTLRRFSTRFARFNLPEAIMRPAYGLAEATLFVATRGPERPQVVVTFEPEKLAAGHAERSKTGTGLISYGALTSPVVRIVDSDTRVEVPAGVVGEIWVHGENVALGYWERPEETAKTFGGTIVNPSAGTPEQGWLKTGDLGFVSEGELFIVGRVKDLLIVRGRNHYPDDIEATVQEISGGRVAAIAVEIDGSEILVAIIEVRKRNESEEEASQRLHDVKHRVTSAISTSHGLSVADLVLVPQGSIPITTSGKVRRAACVEHYRLGIFTRLDA